VAAQAAAHSRKLVARRQFDLSDGAVALRASDVSIGVGFVIENEIRSRKFERRDAVPVLRAVPLMARGALAHGSVAGLDER
jgi:hypothetical protein